MLKTLVPAVAVFIGTATAAVAAGGGGRVQLDPALARTVEALLESQPSETTRFLG
jgi:hypothetical protein